jgi:hypothetical protein
MHLELGAKKTVGVHYATWILSDEHYLEPQMVLAREARERGLSRRVMVGMMGRTVVIPWDKVESEEEEGRSFSEEDREKGEGEGLVLVEGRGGKCVIW